MLPATISAEGFMKTLNILGFGLILAVGLSSCGKKFKATIDSVSDGTGRATTTVTGAATTTTTTGGQRYCTEPVLIPSTPGFDMEAVLNKFAPNRPTQNIDGPVTYCLSYNHTTQALSFRLEWEDDNGIASYPKSGSLFKVLKVNPDALDTEIIILDSGGFFGIKGVFDSADGKVKGSFRFVNLPNLAHIVHWGSTNEITQCQASSYTDTNSAPLRGYYKDTSNVLHRCSTAFNIPLEMWDSNLSTMEIDFGWLQSSVQYSNIIGVTRDYLDPTLAAAIAPLNIEQVHLGNFSMNPL